MLLAVSVVIAGAFLMTYPFLKIASDSDRKMEEIMKKHYVKQSQKDNQSKLPEH